ncbi:MAG TPA: ABC transporter substrate-binding protein [Candidatus Hydrogenedentes bacterium]|nr:ABC transporter substrate-binding protein [Candidatus Hydrogenedentota bacterium]
MQLSRSLVSGMAKFALLGAVMLVLGVGCGGQGGKQRKGIIIMGPHITETVFALKQGHRVIAVGELDDYPGEAQHLPKVGGYLNPDLEQITMLSPELLIVAGKYPKVTEYAEINKLRVLSLNMDSLATIDQGIIVLGHELQCPQKADRLRDRIQAEIQAVRNAVKDLPRSKVLIITGRPSHDLNALNTVNGSSFVSELVQVAGGDNVFADSPQTYFEASKESVVMNAPEVILEFHCGEGLTQSQQDAYYLDWKALSTLPAIQGGRVYFITESHGMRPGPRVGEVAQLMARLLHGEVLFPDWPKE